MPLPCARVAVGDGVGDVVDGGRTRRVLVGVAVDDVALDRDVVVDAGATGVVTG